MMIIVAFTTKRIRELRTHREDLSECSSSKGNAGLSPGLPQTPHDSDPLPNFPSHSLVTKISWLMFETGGRHLINIMDRASENVPEH